jgi:hypothetical protein
MIEIMMGGKPDGHLTHIVTAPSQVDLEQTDDGSNPALQIKSADGTATLLYLS